MKEIFKKLSLVFLGLFIFLASFEVVLRILDYPYIGCNRIFDVWENRLAEFDSELGWSHILNKNTSEKFDYIINEEGYRTYSLDKKTDFSKPIIMFVGGSFTFGANLPYNETFTYKIEKLLDDKFEVLNFGVSAYGTSQSYITMKRYFEKYNPVAVVYVFIGGHLSRNLIYDDRERIPCGRFLGTRPLFKLENDELVLEKKPVTFEEYDFLKVRTFFRDYNPFRISYKDPQQGEYRKNLMEALLRAMVNYTESHNSKMYFIYFEDGNISILLGNNNYDIFDMSPFLSGTSWLVKHPVESANTLLAEKFVEKYGDELTELALKTNINIKKVY